MARKSKKGKDRLDKFYHLAKDQGFRARSAFKLIQLAKKFDFLSKSRVCIDLCAAPGGWSQVAQRNMPAGSLIIAIDLVPIKAIHGVTCIQSDITTEKCRNILKREMKGAPADVVLHDGAPNVGTSWAKDAYSQAELVLHSMKLACEHLRQGGSFVTKVFRSADYNSLLWVFGQLFAKVEATKPTASRNVSAEIFVLCSGFKAGKIDPRFFDPKWVFMETVDPVAEAGVTDRKPTSTLKDYLRAQGRRQRGGYEPGADFKVVPAHEFISSENPAGLLVTSHCLNLEAPGSEHLKDHALTTDEIRELCADLKVLGKKDLSLLLKWRMRLLREREKAERAAAKAGAAAAAAAGAGEAGAGAAGAAAKDVDSAIADLLEEGGAGGGAGAAAAEGGADAAEEELEKELAEQIDKRRRDERREAKKTMARQKRQEFRKKMSLATSNDVQDQPELFKSTKRSVKALEDQDKYIDPRSLDSGQEDSDDGGDLPESESDDGLDRLARLEVDVAVGMELRRLHNEDKFRNSMQRIRKKKKETRRQRVMAAWAGELSEFNQALDRQNAQEHALRDKEDDEEDDDGGDDDSDVDLEALREFQEFQESQQRAVEDGEDAGPDGDALQALLDGPPREEAPAARAAKAGAAGKAGAAAPAGASEGAIVPVDVAGEEILRAEHRASRWFSQDIFRSVGSGDGELRGLGGGSSDGSGGEGDDDDDVEEVDESLLPKLPMSDKQKRRLKRKREKEHRERQGKRARKDAEDDKPMEVAPLEPPKPLVPREKRSKFEKPSDPRELAETLALGSVLVESKKSRMELIDAAYNRWAFERDDSLPEWFTEEENRFNKPELPISKELMDQFRAKLREINARPIRKVAQAKARKKRRLQKRLEKLRSTAMSLVDSPDMSEAAKARQMRKAVSRMANEDRRKVTVVAMKKGGGGNRGRLERGKVPKGAKTKIVDRRMKSDRRGEKKANKRNPTRPKLQARKMARMKTRTNGKKVVGGGAKSKQGDGKGVYGRRA